MWLNKPKDKKMIKGIAEMIGIAKILRQGVPKW